VPLDPQNALLLRAGTTEAALADAAILEADLRRAGVWDRAALPATSKAKTAALLPVIIIGIGLLALAFAIPSVLLRGGGPGRLGLQAGLTIIVVAAIAVMIQGGALSWPGYASFDAQPKLEWR
jgi:hypothetical protein